MICGISMKNKRTHIFYFLSVRLFTAELCPFFDVFFLLCHYKPMEPCQQNLLRTTWARIMIFGLQIATLMVFGLQIATKV